MYRLVSLFGFQRRVVLSEGDGIRVVARLLACNLGVRYASGVCLEQQLAVAVLDSLDEIGLYLVAAVGEGGPTR